MTLEAYNTLIRKLFLYFQRSMPNREQLNLWYDAVEWIPDVAVEWIYHHLASEDMLPRNLPKAIQAGWYAYHRANPNKMARIQEPCDDCMGYGFMIYKTFEENLGGYYKYVIGCANCENWKNTWSDIRREKRCDLVNVVWPSRDSDASEPDDAHMDNKAIESRDARLLFTVKGVDEVLDGTDDDEVPF